MGAFSLENALLHPMNEREEEEKTTHRILNVFPFHKSSHVYHFQFKAFTALFEHIKLFDPVESYRMSVHINQKCLMAVCEFEIHNISSLI